MNVSIIKSIQGDTSLAVWVLDTQEVLSGAPDELAKQFQYMKETKKFSAKKGSFETVVYKDESEYKQGFLGGLGDLAEEGYETVRQLAGELGHAAVKYELETVSIQLPDTIDTLLSDNRLLGQAISSGFVMGAYRYDRYKLDSDKKVPIKALQILSNKITDKAFGQGLKEGSFIGDSVAHARDLANTPANDLTPALFLDHAKAFAKSANGISLDIIDQKKAESLGMGAFLGVAQGSEQAPYMLIFNYHGGIKGDAPLALVGKGVTFDTGGISIKPSKSMGEMKGDMSGAAAVMGAFYGINQMQPKKNIVGIIPLVENMPSGTAMRPGDVITAMNGKTIEVTNTDAEGRLILADALCYANTTFKPKEMINLATLTGAAVVALGDLAIALMGNNQAFIESYKEAVQSCGERVWQMPLYDEYFEYLKSDVADMINANENRLAGTCSAGKFLEQFVSDTPWIHLDIAPLMKDSKSKGYKVAGMAGPGVRNLLAYILS